MAEYCLDCMNKYMMPENKKLQKKDVILDEDFCEGCGEWKPCVVRIKKNIWKEFVKKIMPRK